MNLTKSMMLLAAGATLLPLAAHAETKPTIVVMHRNIHNEIDERNWQNLALDLAGGGYRVVSLALTENETATEGRDELVKLLGDSPEYGKLVLVGTAAASDVVSLTAESETSRVNSVVYVSAEPAVATLGPRDVTLPADLAGKVPSFQIKITDAKSTKAALAETGSTVIRVREDGHSTLANRQDLTAAIVMVASGKHKA